MFVFVYSLQNVKLFFAFFDSHIKVYIPIPSSISWKSDSYMKVWNNVSTKSMHVHVFDVHIVSWHLLGHAIKSVTCFDLPFSRSTRPMTSFCIFITYIRRRSRFLKLEDYKIRSKQVRLNWPNFIQVEKLLFTNVLFIWSFCLWNIF